MLDMHTETLRLFSNGERSPRVALGPLSAEAVRQDHFNFATTPDSIQRYPPHDR